MWKELWAAKSRYAKAWLFTASSIQIALFCVAHENPGWKLFGFGEWENRELMVLAAIGWLLLAALLMHGLDQWAHGCGLQDVYRSEPKGHHQTQERLFVGPILTVESVRAAMTAVILAILLENRKDYLPAPAADAPYWHSIGGLARDPDAVFFLLVTGALASSLITTMAALLCYEYATRFKWPTRDDWRKKNLLEKGFQFGKFGFYCLMWSLAVVPGLLDYQLVFLSTLFVFIVMWIYYFFPAQHLVAPAAPDHHDSAPREPAANETQTAPSPETPVAVARADGQA